MRCTPAIRQLALYHQIIGLLRAMGLTAAVISQALNRHGSRVQGQHVKRYIDRELAKHGHYRLASELDAHLVGMQIQLTTLEIRDLIQGPAVEKVEVKKKASRARGRKQTGGLTLLEEVAASKAVSSPPIAEQTVVTTQPVPAPTLSAREQRALPNQLNKQGKPYKEKPFWRQKDHAQWTPEEWAEFEERNNLVKKKRMNEEELTELDRDVELKACMVYPPPPPPKPKQLIDVTIGGVRWQWDVEDRLVRWRLTDKGERIPGNFNEKYEPLEG